MGLRNTVARDEGEGPERVGLGGWAANEDLGSIIIESLVALSRARDEGAIGQRCLCACVGGRRGFGAWVLKFSMCPRRCFEGQRDTSEALPRALLTLSDPVPALASLFDREYERDKTRLFAMIEDVEPECPTELRAAENDACDCTRGCCVQ